MSTSIQYQVSNKEPQYDIEEEIEKLLKNEGKEIPTIHNVFLCRDGDFYSDPEPGAEHHDDTVRRIGYLVDMKFSENEDIDTKAIHEFMFRSGIIRGHRFAEVPQYDFDIVFPPTPEQIQTMVQIARTYPEVDIGYAISNGNSEQIFGRGIENLLKELTNVFPPVIFDQTKPPIGEANIQASTTILADQEPLQILSFREGEGLFIRTFFADSMFNENGWRITQEALNRDIATGVEKSYFGKTAPFIITPDASHPPDDSIDMRQEQEPYRKGNFLRTGIDERTKKAYVDALITNPQAIQQIQSGEISFVSPSIEPIELHYENGKKVVTRFRINHLAGVKRPAYGTLKAQIKGKCMGSAEECLPILENVQASSIELLPCGGLHVEKKYNISAKHVSAEIKKKILEGQKIENDDIADILEPPKPCHICGQPDLEHNASSNHKYQAEKPDLTRHFCSACDTYHAKPLHAEDSTEQINEREEFFEREKHTQGQKEENKQADDSCVSKWISELAHAHPEWKQDKVVAVAYAKCRGGEHASEHKPEKFEGNSKQEPIKALKDKNSNRNLMSTTQENKISEDEQRRKDLEQQATKMAAMEADLKNSKEQIATLMATINSEVKAPIVEKIVQAKLNAGVIKEAAVQAEKDRLMKSDMEYLKSLNADFIALSKAAEKTVQKDTGVTTRFNYQASTEDKPDKSVTEFIRSRQR